MKQQRGPFCSWGVTVNRKRREIPVPTFLTTLLPSPPSCPHPCCTGRRGYSRPQKGLASSTTVSAAARQGTADCAAPATGLHQDKFTSPETQQLGPRGEAAELGGDFGTFLVLVVLGWVFCLFFSLCPGRLRMCRALGYALPGTAESRGSQAR